jgi:hypothetical protein
VRRDPEPKKPERIGPGNLDDPQHRCCRSYSSVPPLQATATRCRVARPLLRADLLA